VIDLQAKDARATVVPALGGGVATLRWREKDILRPWSGRTEDGPFALGMNILAPFSNRISGPFPWDGADLTVPPNLPGEPFAIHGDAFQRGWDVVAAAEDSVTLHVDGAIGPWRHRCRVTYRLGPQDLCCELVVTNTGDRAMPFGGGFHPWFPRGAKTLLQFRAGGYWPETAEHLRATDRPVTQPDIWDWSEPAPLPSGWINAGFAGWDGRAAISQPGLRLAVAATNCDTAIIYSPGLTSGFFCFEPVSHPVDAHNLPGQPGLMRLAPQEHMTLTISLSWDAT
jgi:aldose 1-epimerase